MKFKNAITCGVFLVMLLSISVCVAGDGIKAEDIDFQDVDVYEYSYRNWHNANWAKWGSISLHTGKGLRRRIYIKFDVNKLMSLADKSRPLELQFFGNIRSGSSAVVKVYRVNEKWNAGDGTYHSGEREPNAPSGQITWNKQPKYDTEKEWSSLVVTNTQHGPIKFDLTDLVKAWKSGKYKNHGLVMVLEDENIRGKNVVFSSSESSAEDQRPVFQAGTKKKKGECKYMLWGAQKAGWGHSVNAKTDGNKLILKKSGVIISQSGEHNGFSIWTGGKAYLTFKRGQSSVGTILPPGDYVIIAGIGGHLKMAKVKLCIDDY